MIWDSEWFKFYLVPPWPAKRKLCSRGCRGDDVAAKLLDTSFGATLDSLSKEITLPTSNAITKLPMIIIWRFNLQCLNNRLKNNQIVSKTQIHCNLRICGNTKNDRCFPSNNMILFVILHVKQLEKWLEKYYVIPFSWLKWK